MEGNTHVQEVNKIVKLTKKHFYGKETFSGKSSYEKGGQTSIKKLSFKCGGEYPHPKFCPAEAKRCNKSHKTGHFAKCCRSQTPQILKFKRDHRPLNKVTTRSNDYNLYDSTHSDTRKLSVYTKRV